MVNLRISESFIGKAIVKTMKHFDIKGVHFAFAHLYNTQNQSESALSVN